MSFGTPGAGQPQTQLAPVTASQGKRNMLSAQLSLFCLAAPSRPCNAVECTEQHRPPVACTHITKPK